MSEISDAVQIIRVGFEGVEVAMKVGSASIGTISTNGFDESAYVFGDGSDFEEKMDEALSVLGDYEFTENDDGTAKFSTEQESYGCVEEKDIKELAEEAAKASPDVEVHISACITATFEEGYDLCVDVDYVNGEMKIDTFEDYFDDDEDDDEEE